MYKICVFQSGENVTN